MGKKFIIAVDKSTSIKNKALIEYLKQRKFAYWHWLSNLWLVTTSDETITAPIIRAEVREIFTKEHMLVIEMSKAGDTWAGFGPNSEKRSMFKWLKNTWNKALEDDKPIQNGQDSDMDEESESS
ncbi:hypothetical protein [Pantoea ananatis]|uniref:hypothetical protein n=1 Tax=Pantoea ananas TaxID=553 RepID=UPI001B309369|nr:hypothetical protein [Pantoea ananatis]